MLRRSTKSLVDRSPVWDDVKTGSTTSVRAPWESHISVSFAMSESVRDTGSGRADGPWVIDAANAKRREFVAESGFIMSCLFSGMSASVSRHLTICTCATCLP